MAAAAPMAGPASSPGAGASVTLHIYDVAGSDIVSGINKLLYPMGTGAFHAGVEVHGAEWSFGYTEEGSGVFSCAPKGCEMHKYRESLPMGRTPLSAGQVEQLIRRLSSEWPGVDYDLLRRNCCTFSDELCVQLGVGHVPKWVTNLAGAGATLHSGFEQTASKAEATAIIAKAKAEDIDAKYQIRSKTEAKAKDIVEKAKALDQKHGISEAAKAGTEKALAKLQELDVKHDLTGKAAKVSTKAQEEAQKAATQAKAFFAQLGSKTQTSK